MLVLLKIVKVLNGDAHPAQVAGGALLGCMLGFTPLLGAHTAALLAALLVFRVNIGTGLLFWGLTKPVALLVLPGLGVPLGQTLLAPESNARAFFAWAQTTPFLGLVEWEKHVVSGGLALGLAAGVLLFVPIVAGIKGYRSLVRERLRQAKAVKVMSSSLLYRLVKGILEGTPE